MRVAIAVLGSLGDLHPFMGLAEEFLKRGHQVTLATSEYYRDYVTERNISFHPIPPNLRPDDRQLLDIVLDRFRGPEKLHKKYLFAYIQQSFDAFLPIVEQSDVVLSGVACYFARPAAEYKAKPWISCLLSPLCFWSAYEPPILAPVPFLGKMRFLGPGNHRWILKVLTKISESWAKPVFSLRKKVGLPRGPNPIAEGMISPQLTLAMFSEVFAKKLPDWPKNASPSGFVFYDGQSEPSIDANLLSFLDASPNPLLFTLGSTAVHHAEKLFDRFCEVAVELNKPAILQVSDADVERLRQLAPKQIGVFGYVPYHWLMPRCGAIVHQGGVGTTAQALRAGVPQLILPSCNDQFDNADRVERMGCGVSLPQHRFTTKRGVLALKKITGDETILNKARLAAQKIHNEQGARTAVELVEQLVSST